MRNIDINDIFSSVKNEIYNNHRERQILIDISTLLRYFSEDNVFVTEHAAERFRQRGIKIKDIRHAVENGEIIEQYPNDYPFPSCLIYGKDYANNVIHVCMSDEGTASRIITAYYPNTDKWDDALKVRKDAL